MGTPCIRMRRRGAGHSLSSMASHLFLSLISLKGIKEHALLPVKFNFLKHKNFFFLSFSFPKVLREWSGEGRGMGQTFLHCAFSTLSSLSPLCVFSLKTLSSCSPIYISISLLW